MLICVFSILYSAAALSFGNSISAFISPVISKAIGICILLFMGIWIIIQSTIKKEKEDNKLKEISKEDKTLFKIAIKSFGITIQVIKNPVEGDLDHSGSIDISESLLLGLALSVDAIGVGIGSALSGFNSIFIPFAVGLFQLSSIYAGTFLGTRFGSLKNINKKLLAVLPGILLILLALFRI